jgi:hypothetical protein
MEKRSFNRWQHRLKREHPTCTERIDSLIDECGWKGGDSSSSADKDRILIATGEWCFVSLCPAKLDMAGCGRRQGSR